MGCNRMRAAGLERPEGHDGEDVGPDGARPIRGHLHPPQQPLIFTLKPLFSKDFPLKNKA